jgi:hypothetical protein
MLAHRPDVQQIKVKSSDLSFGYALLSFVTKFKNLSNAIENIDWTLSSFGR